jgi:hypothetical protein
MKGLTTTGREELIAKLNSKDELKVKEAVATIKVHGDATLVTDLLTVFAATEDSVTVNAISQLLFDLKDQAALNVLIDHLQDPRFESIRVQMLQACWQCGLETWPRLPVFLNIALLGDYMEVLEVLTIVENWDGFPDQLLLKEGIARFRDAMSEMEITEVEDLYLSIVEVLNQFGQE